MNETPATSICPRCEAPLATATVDGLCARCLGALNFDAFTTVDGTGVLPASPPPTAEELAPFLPPFEIHPCLGRGGVGGVYKVRHDSARRGVALRLTAPERESEPALVLACAHQAPHTYAPATRAPLPAAPFGQGSVQPSA